MILRLLFLIFVCTIAHRTDYEHEEVSDKPLCQCLPRHMCSDQDNNKNEEDLMDARFDQNMCPDFYYLCCEVPTTKHEGTLNEGCGFQNIPDLIPRITINSEIAKFGEFPWTILILQRNSEDERDEYICGGSLIHPQVAITASHCVAEYGSSEIIVRAGEWNIKLNNEPFPHQDNNVEEIRIHPQYTAKKLWNDIGLLFLEKPFAKANHIGYICLPPQDLQIENMICIASGWGKSSFRRTSSHSSVLKKVLLPMVSRNICLMELRNTRLGSFFKLHKSFICAGGEEDKDTCTGDGGSPLICPIPGHNSRFMQMGIVSWGIGCGDNETPGIYVNLALYSNWIELEMIKKSFDISYYKY